MGSDDFVALGVATSLETTGCGLGGSGGIG
jgi:hypothetical protein